MFLFISGVQQSDLVIHAYISILFQIFPIQVKQNWVAFPVTVFPKFLWVETPNQFQFGITQLESNFGQINSKNIIYFSVSFSIITFIWKQMFKIHQLFPLHWGFLEDNHWLSLGSFLDLYAPEAFTVLVYLRLLVAVVCSSSVLFI